VASLRPVHAVLGRLASGDWSRAGYYGYPEVLDRLPPGSRVLNLAQTFNNFSFAGANLTNRVIPDFEAPASLTPEYLAEQEIDVVVERPDAPRPADPGAALLHESERFRVWATAARAD
jgi:hypothetical protein